MPYKLVCGLEVHAELKTKSKMFCSCKNDPFGAPKPNLYTCPVCLGMPGALPVANRKAIEWTIKLGLALHCQINLFSKFDRKNYFYADLPKGYQISQYDIPFCHDGYLDTSEGRVGIHRIHLEEDTAKLSHQEIDFDGDGELDKVTLIDFNRSSVPLVEIVTEPDIISATQAKEYGQKLRQIMRYLDIANCDMEKGGMRLEANISLRREGKNELPDYKVECKNINSFKFLEAAINFEVDRQTTILQEDAADYRYFPDPDLPPIEFTTEEIETIRSEIPELPAEKTTRFMSEYNLNEKSAKNLAINMEQALFFEKILKEAKKENLDPQKLINNLLNGKIKFSFDEKISVIIAKFKAISSNENIDEKELQLAIDKVLNAEKDAVAKYKAGKTVVTGFLIGCVMKELGKKADVIQVKQQLIATLS